MKSFKSKKKLKIDITTNLTAMVSKDGFDRFVQ